MALIVFQSTHPARGATPHNLSDLKVARNFNPRTPRGVRLQNQEIQYHQQEFQSTHPARGATGDHLEALTCSGVFQSTHPARGATLGQRLGT